MEDKDLNLAIAKQRGIEVEIIGHFLYHKGTMQNIDYINDSALFLELASELWKTDWEHGYCTDLFVWKNKRLAMSIRDEHFGRATATAYHKQFIGDL